LQGFDAETSLPFVVTQKCGAASVVWDQIAAPGENAHALEHPAPTLAVTTATAGEHDHGATAAPAAVTVGALEISGGFSRATPPNAPVGGGYLTITNKGGEADRLVSAASPVAGVVQIHEMKMEGDLMKMNELPDGIDIPAGETVALAPGGLHIMFMQLTQPLVEGSRIPLTLTFEKAGSVEVELSVESPAAKGPAEDHSMHGG
jgi:copper(I)-binding protein